MLNLINTNYGFLESKLNQENLVSNPIEDRSFLDLLKDQFLKVNDMQLNSNQHIERIILDPKNTNINDVMYNLTKSQLSLYVTKAVVERALRAYNDIINIR